MLNFFMTYGPLVILGSLLYSTVVEYRKMDLNVKYEFPKSTIIVQDSISYAEFDFPDSLFYYFPPDTTEN